MRRNVLSALVLITACDLSMLVAASLAQQAPRPGTASPARPGSFPRVRTNAGAATQAAVAARPGSRFAMTRSFEGRDGNDGSRGGVDPLRPYGDAPRPYERAPVDPLERTAAAPAARRDYFPGLRSGQGPNGNVIDPIMLCNPGRRALLHR